MKHHLERIADVLSAYQTKQALKQKRKAQAEKCEREYYKRIALAKSEWESLLQSKAFRVTVNTEWLEFDNFIRDVGLPPTIVSTLVKDPAYIYYSANTCYWVERVKKCRKIDASSYQKSTVST